MSKKNSSIYIAPFMTVLFFFLLGSCTPLFWIKKYRDMPDVSEVENLDLHTRVTIKEKNSHLERYYVTQYGRRSESKFSAKPIELKENMLVIWDNANSAVNPQADQSYPGVKLTFVHLSDVQLRDEQVRLYDKATSKLADYIIPSFEHGPIQEVYDGAIYYAIIQTINATVDYYNKEDPLRPLFMIHTGDAIDAGVVNELYEFLYISNEIILPWYNAIGNHDVGTFGNIKQKLIYVNDPFVEFMTMHSKFNFVNLHHSAYEFFPFVNVSPTNTEWDYTTRQEDVLYSKYNGFDKLNYSADEIAARDFVCQHCPGYYSIEVKPEDKVKNDPAIQLIVLDTGFMLGAQGIVDDVQLQWLKKELDRSKNKLVLVFGHHNINSITNGQELNTLFVSNQSVAAYFCGHTHKHKISYHHGKNGDFGYWEIITGAIFAYPQQGSIVRVRYDQGFGFLEIFAFKHTIQNSYFNKDGNKLSSELFNHSELAYKAAVDDISSTRKEEIDQNTHHRYAKQKFPYPKLK
jgi:3',5'-cyclic AMP phosphodiesterase CpdA